MVAIGWHWYHIFYICSGPVTKDVFFVIRPVSWWVAIPIDWAGQSSGSSLFIKPTGQKLETRVRFYQLTKYTIYIITIAIPLRYYHPPYPPLDLSRSLPHLHPHPLHLVCCSRFHHLSMRMAVNCASATSLNTAAALSIASSAVAMCSSWSCHSATSTLHVKNTYRISIQLTTWVGCIYSYGTYSGLENSLRLYWTSSLLGNLSVFISLLALSLFSTRLLLVNCVPWSRPVCPLSGVGIHFIFSGST